MGGRITYICKKYTESAEVIRWSTTKKGITLSGSKVDITGKNGGVKFGDYDPVTPKRYGTLNIIRGYWTDMQDKVITEAIVGDTVRFHIETKGIKDGEFIWFGLYDDDRLVNPLEDGKDDPFKLEHHDTHKGYFTEAVKGGKAIITITLNHLESAVKADEDRMLELYYRVSYRKQNIDLPLSKNDYLKLIALPLVIDRYKMPGLSLNGKEIADDMVFGYGVSHIGKIYDDNELNAYNSTYKDEGWDINKHYLFSNLDNEPEGVFSSQALDEVVLQNTQPPVDHTANKPIILVPTQAEQEQWRITEQNWRNRKAKYSRAEILAHRQWMMGLSASSEEWQLRFDFRYMKALMVWGALSAVLDKMIDKFFRKEGGVFEDTYLTESIKNNPSTQQYCTHIEDYLAEHLKEHKGGLVGLEQLAPDFPTQNSQRNSKKKFKTPAFTFDKDGNLIAGRTLALNDIWSTEVVLKSYKKNGDQYSGTYQITLWDHFGIDPPDMDKFFSYGAGFRAWFLLQHLHGYKPFLTKITFEQAFSGNISIGMDERVRGREADAQRKAAQEKEDERLRQMTRKKPWEY